MRRDICHYYQMDIINVFNAYVRAATEKFGRECKAEPYHTLSFGLNFSFRYNMNGGACTVHFMPCNGNATAVDVRFSIAQLWGARYESYDEEVTKYVEGILGVPAGSVDINVDDFLLPQNQYTPQVYANNVPNAPLQASAPAPQQKYSNFCSKCGAKNINKSAFCTNCGTSLIHK